MRTDRDVRYPAYCRRFDRRVAIATGYHDLARLQGAYPVADRNLLQSYSISPVQQEQVGQFDARYDLSDDHSRNSLVLDVRASFVVHLKGDWPGMMKLHIQHNLSR